jgi:hypothetical protein
MLNLLIIWRVCVGDCPEIESEAGERACCAYGRGRNIRYKDPQRCAHLRSIRFGSGS